MLSFKPKKQWDLVLPLGCWDLLIIFATPWFNYLPTQFRRTVLLWNRKEQTLVYLQKVSVVGLNQLNWGWSVWMLPLYYPLSLGKILSCERIMSPNLKASFRSQKYSLNRATLGGFECWALVKACSTGHNRTGLIPHKASVLEDTRRY